MKRIILLVIYFIVSNLNLLGQDTLKKISYLKRNELSISPIFLWSKYAVVNQYGIFGSDKLSNGDSWSNGINVIYSYILYKGVFLIAGVGYFKQNFDFSKTRVPANGGFRASNTRPFDYNSQLALLYSTDHYLYNNYHFMLGAGYNYLVNSKFNIKSSITYNQMHTYKQKYNTTFDSDPPQINKMNYVFYKSFIFSVGGIYKISKRISTGIHILLPLSTKYRKDYIFRENTNEYFKPNSSLGISISTNYHF